MKDNHKNRPSWDCGVLKLRVHLPHTWTANVNTDITATLEKHQGIIESTLAAHFGLQSAKVVECTTERYTSRLQLHTHTHTHTHARTAARSI